MNFAADYTDEWYMVGSGAEAKAFRCFYVCGRPCGGEICASMMLSSHWVRRAEDPLATGQRWYCRVCNARYKTNSGVLVEMVCQGEVTYLRADFPPDAMQQVKWASVQRSHPDAVTPTALLEAIPDAQPMTQSGFLRRKEGFTGVWTYDHVALLSVPKLQWGTLLPPVPGPPPHTDLSAYAASLREDKAWCAV